MHSSISGLEAIKKNIQSLHSGKLKTKTKQKKTKTKTILKRFLTRFVQLEFVGCLLFSAGKALNQYI